MEEWKLVDHTSISADRYLGLHSIKEYFEEALTQYQAVKVDNSATDLTEFLARYFGKVKNGEHVLFRPFSFVNCTAYNRRCFVRLLWKSLHQFLLHNPGEVMSIQELYSFVELLCSDFPLVIVQHAGTITATPGDKTLVALTDFIYAFQLVFYYNPFIDTLSELASNLQSLSHNVIDVEVLIQQIAPVCLTADYTTPSLDSLRQTLQGFTHISKIDLFIRLAKSEAVNSLIGAIPSHKVISDRAYLESLIPPTHRPLSAVPPAPVSPTKESEKKPKDISPTAPTLTPQAPVRRPSQQLPRKKLITAKLPSRDLSGSVATADSDELSSSETEVD